jgi:hypothetical protein
VAGADDEQIGWLVDAALALGIEMDREQAERWTTAYHREADAMHVPLPADEGLRAAGDAGPLTDYLERLTDEVHWHATTRRDYRRALAAIYNVFRLTGRRSEAAQVRALSGTPLAALAFVGAAIEARPRDAAAAADEEAARAEVDRLLMSAVIALDGSTRAAAVRGLLRLRDALGRPPAGAADRPAIGPGELHHAARFGEHVRRRLVSLDSVRAYLDSLATKHE